MTPNPNQGTKSSEAKPSSFDSAMHPYTDEPVPSYETALQEGAGGGVAAAGPSSNATPSAQQTQPEPGFAPSQRSYGCSPYTPNGTARIVIVPAPHWHVLPSPPNQPLLPAPVSVPAAPIRRAGPRFFLALLQAFMIYILINLLVDLTVTHKW